MGPHSAKFGKRGPQILAEILTPTNGFSPLVLTVKTLRYFCVAVSSMFASEFSPLLLAVRDDHLRLDLRAVDLLDRPRGLRFRKSRVRDIIPDDRHLRAEVGPTRAHLLARTYVGAPITSPC